MILLNLGIVEEQLREKPEFHVGEPFHEMCIHNARLMPRPLDGPYNASTLYVAGWSFLRDQNAMPEYLICVGGGREAADYLAARGVSGAVYPADTDMVHLFSEIQDAFDLFHVLHSDYRSMLISQHSMHEIVNAAADFFRCFSVLFDTHCNVLECCSNYLPGMPCSPKDSAGNTNALIAELLLSVRRHQGGNGETRPGPQITFVPAEDGTPSYYLARFFDGNRCIGMFAVCGEPNALRGDAECLFRYVVNLMAPCIVGRFSPAVKTFSHIRSAISSLIDNISFNYSSLSESLTKVGWNLHDCYQLVYIRVGMSSIRNLYTVTDFYRYESLFPDCIALKARLYVVVLIHNPSDELLRHSMENLQQLMTDYRMECIVSLPFGDFMQIGEQYQILRSAMNMSEPRESITLYRDIMAKHIVSEMSRCLSVRSLCHISAVQIYQYDQRNGTELLSALEQYLRHNQSLQDAAEELYIHRNTLNYRLKACMKIAELPLDSTDGRIHLLLSCIVLRNLKGQDLPAP